ncbi:hypothetical protein MNBD_ALPHA08-497 [hydrothermal vent metagenome]|uniref:DUF3168 domain-containing protein n=1 Tax=hydrothermal vent metagenome TaxID=652676 RepID=A0A3B0RX31_9ZZZZ
MPLNPALDLQVAIHAALTSHPGTLSVLGGANVFDDVPQRTSFPYVTIGDIETRDWDTQTSIGHEHIITLHIWSDHHGRKQVQTIIGEIDDALDDSGLSLQNHMLINLHVIFWSAMRDLDDHTYHGIIRLRAVTEKT